MDKWKLGVIALLFLGLVGYGYSASQQKSENPTVEELLNSNAALPDANSATGATEENKAAAYIGQELGGAKLPEWSKLGPWANTKTPLALKSLKGKPAMIEFFRIDCSHCQEAAPFMEALYQRYQPRGLKMVAVQAPVTNEEKTWPKVQEWVKAGGLTYPVAMDKGSQYFQHTIGGNYYPTTMITDANGKVTYAQTGHDTAKSITLAVELEKAYPGAGTPKQRAQSLMKFLRPFVFGPGTPNAKLEQSLTDDLEQRLLGKV